jgi:hypothetical protein
MWIRGLTIWVGAALIGSVVGTVGLQLISHGGWAGEDLRSLIGIGLLTLVFTVAGSALLFLAFWRLAKLRAVDGWSYAILVLFGGLAGAFMLSFLGASGIGAAYGVVTALAWVALLRLTKFDRTE